MNNLKFITVTKNEQVEQFLSNEMKKNIIRETNRIDLIDYVEKYMKIKLTPWQKIIIRALERTPDNENIKLVRRHGLKVMTILKLMNMWLKEIEKHK